MRGRTWFIAALSAIVLVFALGGAALASTGRVTGQIVNLRSAPGTSARIVGKLSLGQTVSILGTRSGWYQVKTASGITGWASGQYIKASSTPSANTTATKTTSAASRVTVTGSVVNLRSGPSTTTAIVGKATRGQTLDLVKALTGWYQVKLANGKTAYISSSLARVSQSSPASPPASTTAPGSAAGQTSSGTTSAPGGTSSSGTGGTAAPAAESAAGKVTVTGSVVNLRQGPSTSCAVVGKVTRGQQLAAVSSKDGWFEVLTTGGKAWISGTLVTITAPIPAGTEPSRGTERPDSAPVNFASGQDAEGDYIKITAAVTPEVSESEGAVTVRIPGGQMPAAGLPGSVKIDGDGTLAVSVTAESGEGNLAITMKVPGNLKYTVNQGENTVSLQVPPQVISLREGRTTLAGYGAVEVAMTAPVKTEGLEASGDDLTCTLPGLQVENPLELGEGQGYVKAALASRDGTARLELRLKDGYRGVLLPAGDLLRISLKPVYETSRPTIVIDAGHGGSDPGAQYGGANEKDLTLAMALKLGALLKEQGYDVACTRSDDTYVSLEDRCKAARDADARIFLSIHCNASVNTAASGTTTYYTVSDDPYLTAERQSLASAVQASLVGALGLPDRRVQTESFYVIKNTPMLSILVETAFLSNPADRAILTSEEGQDATARAIGEGLRQYLGE